MLAMADRRGRVWASIPGLANRARVSITACEKALSCFLSPDEYSRTKDFDGVRIEVIDGGWRLLNHQKYRDIRDEETRKEQNAASQARFRSKQSKPEVSTSKPTRKPIAEAEAEAIEHYKEVSASPFQIPESLNNPKFVELWDKWLEHLKQKRKTPTILAAEMQIKNLSDMGIERAIAALQNSISGNYQGIYEPNQQKESKQPIEKMTKAQILAEAIR